MCKESFLSAPRDGRELPRIVSTVSGRDLVRTHFTFTNVGRTPALSVAVDTIRQDGQTLDFEPIQEIPPGASLICLSIVHPVVGNDPHWAFDFWTASGEKFMLPFVVRYNAADGRPFVARNILRWDGRDVLLLPDQYPNSD